MNYLATLIGYTSTPRVICQEGAAMDETLLRFGDVVRLKLADRSRALYVRGEGHVLASVVAIESAAREGRTRFSQPESGGRAPTIDTASGWALAKAFTLWRTVGPGGAAAGSSKAPMARVLRAREKSGRRRNMAASRSALKGGRSERRPVALDKFGAAGGIGKSETASVITASHAGK